MTGVVISNRMSCWLYLVLWLHMEVHCACVCVCACVHVRVCACCVHVCVCLCVFYGQVQTLTFYQKCRDIGPHHIMCCEDGGSRGLTSKEGEVELCSAEGIGEDTMLLYMYI